MNFTKIKSIRSLQENFPESGLPKKLYGDTVRLKQILINLVKNGLKFTRGGQVGIVMTYDQTEALLKVHVVDSGQGIREEDMEILFKQFGKLRRTAAMNSEGIGMGLMICKNLVSKNGGTISVQSEGVNKGSTFTFTMNMESQEEEQKVQNNAHLSQLIIEEEPAWKKAGKGNNSTAILNSQTKSVVSKDSQVQEEIN